MGKNHAIKKEVDLLNLQGRNQEILMKTYFLRRPPCDLTGLNNIFYFYLTR